jgi:hypothetical protein
MPRRMLDLDARTSVVRRLMAYLKIAEPFPVFTDSWEWANSGPYVPLLVFQTLSTSEDAGLD